MGETPSFASFPDLPEPRSKPAAQSATQPAVPAFSTFPDLNLPRPSRHADNTDRIKRRRTEDKRRDNQDARGQKAFTWQLDRPAEGKSSHNERDQRDRDGARRHRRRDSEITEHDDSARRIRKDERRRQARENADELIRGERRDVSFLPPSESTARGKTREKERSRLDDQDGAPWYESSTRDKPGRTGYEEPFDPASNKGFPDVVGDKDALRYSSTASAVAPRYYRDANGRILGLNEGLRTTTSRDRTEKGLEIAPRGRSHIPRYSARTLESSAASHLSRLVLRPNEQPDKFDPQTPFVAFGTTPRKPQPDIDVPSHRDIDIRRDNDQEDDDLVAAETTLGDFATVEQAIRAETAEMEKHLKEHSQDIDSWIKYSTLHTKLSPDGGKEAAGSSTDIARLPQNRASAEVTLSVLEKALKANPRNFASPPLHIAYLRSAEIFWQPHNVTMRWKQIIRDLGERATRERDAQLKKELNQLWLGYIEWREGQGFGQTAAAAGTGGGVDAVVDVYIECFEALGGFHQGEHARLEEESQLYLFLRACLFMKQAGYAERAMACFQAMMEFTFFKPDYLRPPAQADQVWFEGVVAEFEQFWESEVPRFGEAGALGWNQTSSDTPHDPAHAHEFEHEANDPFERWLEAERQADQRSTLPGRATDLDEDEEDPFRVVLFADIQPFLFVIRSPEVRSQLVYALLAFLGLPFTPPEVSTTASSANNLHLQNKLAYNDIARIAFWPLRPSTKRIAWQTVGGEAMEPEVHRAIADPFRCPVKSWAFTRDSLFAQTSKWFRDADRTDLDHVDAEFARNAFKLLRPLISDPAFSLVFLAFESALSPKAAIKTAKSILSENRDNLLLWDGYARIERQKGNVAAARTVYVTALQAASRAKDRVTDDELDLWASWADMEFGEANHERCREVLSAAASFGAQSLTDHLSPDYRPSPPSSLAMLKAKQHYSSRSYPLTISDLTLGALFAYSTSGIDAVQHIVERQITLVPADSYFAEAAHQLWVKILHHHTSRHPSPAALTRTALEDAIRSFPNNTMFLSLYLWGELGSRVHGRLQRLIASTLSTAEGGLTGHLWAVWAEAMSAHRTFWDQGGNGASRVRTALDKGINSRLGRQSVALWKLYIDFENHMGRSSAVKSLCYRAVAAIGGCKELYLLPFSPALSGHFSAREICDWSELMSERGIRVRVPFERFFDTVGPEDPTVVLPEDEDLQDDELKFLTDIQEAKPY